MSVETMVDQVIELGRLFRPELVVCESNMFQSLILTALKQKSQKAGLRFQMQGVNNTMKKEVRIRRLGPHLEQKNLLFTKCQGNKILVDQLRLFPSSQHDDGPDALELALRSLVFVCNNKMKPTSQGIRS